MRAGAQATSKMPACKIETESLILISTVEIEFNIFTDVASHGEERMANEP